MKLTSFQNLPIDHLNHFHHWLLSPIRGKSVYPQNMLEYNQSFGMTNDCINTPFCENKFQTNLVNQHVEGIPVSRCTQVCLQVVGWQGNQWKEYFNNVFNHSQFSEYRENKSEPSCHLSWVSHVASSRRYTHSSYEIQTTVSYV